jgi:hypothetical protein
MVFPHKFTFHHSASGRSMPKYTIARFDPDAGPITARLICGFAQQGRYTYFLWDTVANRQLDTASGLIGDDEPDEVEVPDPISDHHMHAIEFLGTVNLEPPLLNFSVVLQAVQGGRVLATAPARAGTGTPHQTIPYDLYILLVDSSRTSGGAA